MCMHTLAKLCFYPHAFWGGIGPFLLLLILDCPLVFVKKQLLEEHTFILSSWTLLLWPSDLRLTSPALSFVTAQFSSFGPLGPTLWRRPSCFNLVSISFETVPNWKRLRKGYEGENWIWLGEICKTSVFCANSSQIRWDHNMRPWSGGLWKMLLPAVRQPWLFFLSIPSLLFPPILPGEPVFYKSTHSSLLKYSWFAFHTSVSQSCVVSLGLRRAVLLSAVCWHALGERRTQTPPCFVPEFHRKQ